MERGPHRTENSFEEDKHRNRQLSRECHGRSAQSLIITTETSLTSNSVDWIALLFQLILIVTDLL